LLLFLAPSGFLLIGAGVAELNRLVGGLKEEAASLAGMVLILVWGGPRVLPNVRAPLVREENRVPAERILGFSPDEPVYIGPTGIPAWLYYSTDWSRPPHRRLASVLRLTRPDGPSAINGLIAERGGQPDSALQYQAGGRTVLLGRRSGIRVREPEGLLQGQPDPGWVEGEVSRMVRVARPYLWIYGSHLVEGELPPIRAELYRRGIRIVEAWEGTAAAAVRIRVPAGDSAGYRVPAPRP
jgi:hypothetical protein